MRDQDATTVAARHMYRYDLQIAPNSCFRVFRFPEFAEFIESSVLFRKNSNMLNSRLLEIRTLKQNLKIHLNSRGDYMGS